MKRKVLLVMMSMLVTLVGCGAQNQEVASVDASVKQELDIALQNLKEREESYVITNYYNSPDGELWYLDVVTSNGDSYTEYPMDEDGLIGQSLETENYMLSDWMTDDAFYVVVDSEDTEGNATTSFSILPDNYRDLCESRKYLYGDWVIPNLYDVTKKEEPITSDDGSISYTIYEGRLPAEQVRKIIGVGSEGLYKCVQEAYKDDEAISKYCSYYLEKYDFTLIFSDAIVTLGVADNQLRYLNLEIGGLGTEMYYTMSLSDLDFTARTTPDFTAVSDYVDTKMRPTAEYLQSLGADSIEDVQNILQDGYTDEMGAYDTIEDSDGDILYDLNEEDIEAIENKEKAEETGETEGAKESEETQPAETKDTPADTSSAPTETEDESADVSDTEN